MKNIKYVLFSLLFFISLNVKAANVCSSDEMKRLRELANNVEVKETVNVEEKNYNEDSKDVWTYFDLEIINYDKDLIIFYKESSNDEKIKIEKNNYDDLYFFGGDQITFYIYSYTTNSCTNKLLKSFTKKLDYYNTFYYFNKDECEKNKNFEYCQEYVSKEELSYEEIYEKFVEYKNTNNLSVKKNIEKNYLIYIMSILVVLIIVIIIIVIKKKKHRRSLEV